MGERRSILGLGAAGVTAAGTCPTDDGKGHSAANGLMFDKNAKLDALFENTEDLGYDVRMYYKEPEESRCVRIATNDLFGNLTLVVIAFNVLWLAIDADLNTGSS